MSLNTISINENTWIFDEGGVRFFLLAGTKKALLIDSGMATKNALEEARALTDLPVSLINTHADMDHVGSNEEFQEFYMAPADADQYRKEHPGHEFVLLPAEDGMTIDLGERTVEIISTPGHTPGSIAILDIKAKNIYTGDPIQKNGSIFMFGQGRSMEAYIESIQKIMNMADRFERIYPSHGDAPVTADILPALSDGAKKILAGELTGQTVDMFGNKVNRVDVGVSAFLLAAGA